jgi:GAF domain-containing protein
MTALPQNAVADLERTVADLERQLQSTATENDRLRGELGIALERQNATADILRTIASAPGDAGRSLQRIAETCARLFGAPGASILLAKDGEWGQSYRFGDSARRIRAAVPLSEMRVDGPNLPGEVITGNRQIHIPDLDHIDPSMADWPGPPHARAAGTRTMCGTPLRRDDKAIGALIVYRDQLLPFTAEELALLQSLAEKADIAKEKDRMFNDTREALERQTATSDILKVIASSRRTCSRYSTSSSTRGAAVRRPMGRVYRYDGELIHGGRPRPQRARRSEAERPFRDRPRTTPSSDGSCCARNILTDLNEDETVPPLSPR